MPLHLILTGGCFAQIDHLATAASHRPPRQKLESFLWHLREATSEESEKVRKIMQF
jgi:hypothetical protein